MRCSIGSAQNGDNDDRIRAARLGPN